jgi:DnaJ-class molecular chaperone
MSESFYNILGINEKSSKEEIKKAYRTLSLKYHPDKNPNNQEAYDKFQKINEAYETLGDEQKREEYDMMKKNPFFKMANYNGNPNSMESPFQDMDEIFNAIFGGSLGGGMSFGGPNIRIFRSGPPHKMQKPQPIIKTLKINIEQVLIGGTVPLEIERWIIENDNKVFENETIYINIPKGIDDNEIILLKDKGNVISEETKGDIKIVIKIENNTEFERKGIDLIINKTISLKDSLCGFTFELKYINGKVYTLNNNSGSIIPPEYIKVIPNLGLTRDGHTGNLLIHFHVDFPEKLSEEQIQKLKEIL